MSLLVPYILDLLPALLTRYMNRYEFLKNLGLSGATLFAALCAGSSLQSCKKKSVVPQNADFTLDISAPDNSALQTNGGWLVRNDVVIARTNQGNFVAVTVICSHAQQKQVAFIAANNNFVCSAHGATFSVTGQGLNSTGAGGLRTYQTQLTGNNLRIF
jgi:cytochrome b6-f complex iron-sulfur subunit